MKKFVGQIEDRLRQQVFYMKTGQRLSYRGVILEQVRSLARSLGDEEIYEPFSMR
jgi:CRISPR/Cas system-associated endonuclease Cas1